ANGARFGVWSTVPANTGYHIATWVVTLLIGLGFVAALEEFPQMLLGVKILGSLYVLWLAWKLLRSGVLQSQPDPKPATFRDGVILLMFNPKAYFIIAAMFAQFLAGTGSDNTALVLWISTVFTLNNLLAFTLWTILGDGLARQFRDETNAKILNVVFGLLLAAVAIWMLVL
ncbi:MAG: LysE family translocator, partial [Pseudomonadota bacterium]